MSSTNRGKDRNASDYYITPIAEIEKFLGEVLNHEPTFLGGTILDPCAGGDEHNEMSYPVALQKFTTQEIITLDIRSDSKADYTGVDYLKYNISQVAWNIISNPPFYLAPEFIQKALDDVLPGGFVTMLLRLNFFGSAKRYTSMWSDGLMPKYCFVHSRRMPFGLNKHGKVGTDSIEYAHFVWHQGHRAEFTQLKVIAP